MAKAQAMMRYLIFIVLTIVVLVILLRFFGFVGPTSGDIAAEEACERGIRAQARLATISSQDLAKLPCETKYIPIRSKDPEFAKQTLANEMANCWSRWARLGTEFFEAETGNYCIVCSSLEFREPTQISGLTEYLIENNGPGGEPFYKSLNPDADIDAIRRNYDPSADVLNVDGPLGVMFIMTKKYDGSATTYLLSALGVGIGVLFAPFTLGGSLFIAGLGVTGYVAGEATRDKNYEAHILVYPYEKIGELKCTRLEGKAGSLQIIE